MAEHRFFDDDTGPAISNELFRPNNLPKSKPPLTLVCGAPGSGKTTWVKQQANDRAVIIDLGEISDRLAGHKGARTPSRSQWLRKGLEERNRILRGLATSGAPEVFFIIGAPTAAERRAWAEMLGAVRTVILLTPKDETLRRNDADPLRMWVRKPLRYAILKWWAEYTPGHGEVIEPD